MDTGRCLITLVKEMLDVNGYEGSTDLIVLPYRAYRRT